MSIQWDEKHSVGVKEIDEQHKKFIAILNDLYEHINQLSNRDELGEILRRVIAYAELHFATEEKYFDLFNYEFSAEHKNEHHKLTAKAIDFQNKFMAGKEEITLDLVDFLENWLVDHLDGQDKKYTKCFHDHGLY